MLNSVICPLGRGLHHINLSRVDHTELFLTDSTWEMHLKFPRLSKKSVKKDSQYLVTWSTVPKTTTHMVTKKSSAVSLVKNSQTFFLFISVTYQWSLSCRARCAAPPLAGSCWWLSPDSRRNSDSWQTQNEVVCGIDMKNFLWRSRCVCHCRWRAHGLGGFGDTWGERRSRLNF